MKCDACPLKGSKVVPGLGPKDAKIMIVGEAPGATEEFQGKPFVGGAGRVLDNLLRRAGIDREKCWVTNVVKCRPPNNTMDWLYYECCVDALYKEVEDIRPNVIVALGNWALKALTGKPSVTRYRGSILEGHGCKVIPTLHPAALMRQRQDWSVVQTDFIRIKEESEFPERRLDEERFILNPTLSDLREFCKGVGSVMAVDVEVDAGVIVCLSLSREDGLTICIPFLKKGGEQYWTQEELKEAVEEVGRVLEDESVAKVFHNAAFDVDILAEHGIEVKGKIDDTMLAHHTLYSELRHSLAFVASIYSHTPFWKDDVKDQGQWDEILNVEDKTLWEYNARDSNVTRIVWTELKKELEESELVGVYERVVSLVPMVIELNDTGLALDQQALKAHRELAQEKVEKCAKKVYEEVGEEFDLSSPKELARILFNKLKYPSFIKTKTGGDSTNAKALDRLLERYPDSPILREIEEWKKYNKQLTTFLHPPVQSDGRVHSTYLLHGTATGRLSSRNPNLQNYTPELRDIFVPGSGRVFVACDYEQLELRLIAILSGCKAMLKAFEEGRDIHSANASKLFGIPESEVNRDQRFDAKIFVYAKNYGGDVTGVRFVTLRDREAVKRLEEAYDREFFEIAEFRERVGREALRTRIVKNPLGRRRVLFSPDEAEVQRQAVNTMMQSSAAEILNQGCVNFLARRKRGWKFCSQLHDSVMLEVVESEAEEAAQVLKESVEWETPIGVFPAEVKIGRSWKEVS